MKLNTAISLITLFLSLAAFAQNSDIGTNRIYSPATSFGSTAQHGFAGYVAANLGYSGYNSNIDVEGMPSSMKILGSYVTENSVGVFDLGYGIQNQTFSQSAAADTTISTGVMEVASRYQFENRWQLGAVYNQFFNKGPSYSANQADVEFVGVQLLREFNFEGNYLGRVGGRLMSSLNVDNETVNMAIIDFQIGWGGSAKTFSSALN
jgi:OmpA-OmpF porin, OOP family